METLCKIRDINRAVAQVEQQLQKLYNISLNEGMLLCSLAKVERMSSGEIAQALGLTASNTSKVIKSAENKQFIGRIVGHEDKRQMYFSLTDKGAEALARIKCEDIDVPPLLKCL